MLEGSAGKVTFGSASDDIFCVVLRSPGNAGPVYQDVLLRCRVVPTSPQKHVRCTSILRPITRRSNDITKSFVERPTIHYFLPKLLSRARMMSAVSGYMGEKKRQETYHISLHSKTYLLLPPPSGQRSLPIAVASYIAQTFSRWRLAWCWCASARKVAERRG